MRLVVLLFLAACSSQPIAPGDPTGPVTTTNAPSTTDGGAITGSTDASVAGPYPIVLVHGFSGFDHIGPVDYFYGVADALTALGRDVYTPRLDAYDGSPARGQALVGIVQGIVSKTGKKVVLVGHSQGGLDSRWVASFAPELVAGVVTIATPHRGSSVADVALGVTPFGGTEDALSLLAGLFGAGTNGEDPNLESALQTLSSKGAAAFNAMVPDAPNIPYWSIAGRSGLAGKSSCDPSTEPFIAKWDGDRDTIDPALSGTWTILEATDGVNDGLVAQDSARWGTYLGCIPADHLNEICQIAGASPGLGNGFDCLTFYRDLVGFLSAHDL